MIDRLFLATKEKHISLPPSSILPPQQLPIPNGGSHKRSSPSPCTHSPFDGIFIKEGEWEMAKRSFAAKSFIATTQFVGGGRARTNSSSLLRTLKSFRQSAPSLPPSSLRLGRRRRLLPWVPGEHYRKAKLSLSLSSYAEEEDLATLGNNIGLCSRRVWSRRRRRRAGRRKRGKCAGERRKRE